MPNLLLTSVGRRVELVRSFKDAYRRLGVIGSIVGTDVDWLAPAFQEVDEAVVVPRFGADDYLPAILQICQTQAIDAIFPLNDGELPYLSKFRSRIEETGARVAILDPDSVAICADKTQTVGLFKQLGLPTAESWLPEQVPANVEFPLFIKPRDGSAGESIFKIDSIEELKFFSTYVRNPIIQEFLPGPEITTDVVCGFDSSVLAIVSRERIAVRGGEAIKSVTIRDERIEHACREIAASLPARGPITVQCMMKDRVPHFIEINARLGGGIPLAIAAGVDVTALLLSEIGGLPMDGLSREPALGLYMTRCDESFFLTERERGLPSSRHLRS